MSKSVMKEKGSSESNRDQFGPWFMDQYKRIMKSMDGVEGHLFDDILANASEQLNEERDNERFPILIFKKKLAPSLAKLSPSDLADILIKTLGKAAIVTSDMCRMSEFAYRPLISEVDFFRVEDDPDDVSIWLVGTRALASMIKNIRGKI